MSQKIDLDFSQNQAFSLTRFTPFNLLILLVGLLMVIYVTLLYQAKDAEYNKMQVQLDQLHPAKKPDVINADLQKIPASELKQVNETVADLSTPWDQLLSALEQVDMHDVALLSLEPSKKKRQVVFGGQAKNMQAALYYIEALERLPMLSQVYLQKHNIDQLDPFKPVAFTIVAQWS
jgi:hypothetical protein